MAETLTLRQTIEAARAHHEIACPPRSELKRVTEARAEFRQTVREALRSRNPALSMDAIDEQCRAAVMNFDCSLIARLRNDQGASAWRDRDGTDAGLIVMPPGEYWDGPAAKCVLRVEGLCQGACAELKHCRRRDTPFLADKLIPAEVLWPGANDAPVLISSTLADLIAIGALAREGLSAESREAISDQKAASSSSLNRPKGISDPDWDRFVCASGKFADLMTTRGAQSAAARFLVEGGYGDLHTARRGIVRVIAQIRRTEQMK
jgi:hypothetical protein